MSIASLLTKVRRVKAMVFPVVTYGCESWTIKKAEHWRIDAFELCHWRRFLRVPWTARRSSQSILKAINPEYSWEGLMLKLKPQYFGHLMWKASSLEKTLMLGKIEGRRKWGWQEMKWLDGITKSVDKSSTSSGRWCRTRKAGLVPSWGHRELDHKEGCVLKNWCFQIMVLEKTLESPLDCKEIKPVHPKGNEPWIFIRRTDAEAETPGLWLPDVKNWLIGKDPDAGKDWRQEETGMTEDEMVGWHHWLDGHECEQTPGNSEGQGSLVCCRSWGSRVEYDLVTEQQEFKEAKVFA